MKKCFMFLPLLFLSTALFSQSEIDSFLGTKGIFSKLSPKTINPNNTLSFDLKVTIHSTGVKNKQKSEVIMYLNTKDGYEGVDHSVNPSKSINENDSNLDFIVETLTKQSFKYSNNAGVKKVEKLETNLINNYNNLPFKKSDPTVSKPKKYLSNTITAWPYFTDVYGLQKKLIRYCYGTENNLEGSLKSYLGCFGLGFYNVSNSTILCVATENSVLNIEITKIEKVKIVFNTSNFKI